MELNGIYMLCVTDENLKYASNLLYMHTALNI